MPPIVYGSIKYSGKSYPFFIEERRVNIVGSAWEYYEDFQCVDEEESISGLTSDNRNRLIFLLADLGFSVGGSKVFRSPSPEPVDGQRVRDFSIINII